MTKSKIVATNPTTTGLHTVSGEIDGPLGEVDVHQVVDDPALDVAVVLVHHNL